MELLREIIAASDEYKVLAHSALLALLGFLFSLAFANRTNYLYQSRQADMHILEHALKANKSADLVSREIARHWLRFSEDYLHKSWQRGYTALVLAFSLLSLIVSIGLAFVFNVDYWPAAYFSAIILLVAAAIVHVTNYGYKRGSSLRNRVKALGFGASPRWPFISRIIEENDWLKEFYKEIRENPDLYKT